MNTKVRKEKIQLSDHFDFKKLLRFVIPSIIMMIFFCGIGVFGSALFTALNNGVMSAAISFLRTLVFQVMTILIMPAIWEIEGVWYAIIVSETLAALTSVIFIVSYRKKYKY